MGSGRWSALPSCCGAGYVDFAWTTTDQNRFWLGAWATPPQPPNRSFEADATGLTVAPAGLLLCGGWLGSRDFVGHRSINATSNAPGFQASICNDVEEDDPFSCIAVLAVEVPRAAFNLSLEILDAVVGDVLAPNSEVFSDCDEGFGGAWVVGD